MWLSGLEHRRVHQKVGDLIPHQGIHPQFGALGPYCCPLCLEDLVTLPEQRAALTSWSLSWGSLFSWGSLSPWVESVASSYSLLPSARDLQLLQPLPSCFIFSSCRACLPFQSPDLSTLRAWIMSDSLLKSPRVAETYRNTMNILNKMFETSPTKKSI